MKLSKGTWEFNAEVTKEFDSHVQQSVPFYQEIQSMISEISTWFLQDDTNYYDVGSSTGYTAYNILKDSNRNVVCNLIDNSPDMCQVLREKFDDGNVMEISLDDNNSDVFNNASLITSMLTLQFISEDHRQGIINNIHKGLRKGSAFILVEKVLGSSSKTENIWSGMYHDLKLKQGLTKDHIFDKSQSIRGVMTPISLEENVDMLNSAGFREVEVFFRWANFVGIIAIK